jgi:hypothetical protein
MFNPVQTPEKIRGRKNLRKKGEAGRIVFNDPARPSEQPTGADRKLKFFAALFLGGFAALTRAGGHTGQPRAEQDHRGRLRHRRRVDGSLQGHLIAGAGGGQ